MKTKKEVIFNVLSKSEQKNVMGGLVPPTPKDNENKSAIQKLRDEILSGTVCW